MTFPPAAAVMTRRKFAGMRSAIVTSHVIGGAHSVAAEILRDFTRPIAPRLIKLCYVMLCYVMLCYVILCYVMLCYVMLCYVNASVRLRQRHYPTWSSRATCRW